MNQNHMIFQIILRNAALPGRPSISAYAVRSDDQLGHFDAFADADKIATHLGLSDVDEYVTPAVATPTEFFEQHLAKA